MTMEALFIAGTDTGVGKTVVTGCLARYLTKKGYNVITQKWVQTGCNSNLSSDIKLHLKIMGRRISQIKPYLAYISPYVFRMPASAHLASRLEDERIDKNKIIRCFSVLSGAFDFVLVEGLGGVLVPFNNKELVVDIVRALDLPVLIVAGNKLGAVNHTLLTIEALKARKIKILGLVFNNLREENKQILEDNPRIVGALSKERVFGVLTRERIPQKLYERFAPIGKKISQALLKR